MCDKKRAESCNSNTFLDGTYLLVQDRYTLYRGSTSLFFILKSVSHNYNNNIWSISWTKNDKIFWNFNLSLFIDIATSISDLKQHSICIKMENIVINDLYVQ